MNWLLAKRVVAVSILVSAVLFLFWAAGFDFDERGFVAFCAALSSMYIAAAAFIFID